MAEHGDPGGCELVCLLPVRNGEKDLPGYLESVSQFADGVVALDDGSTDGTAEILDRHPIVRLLLTNPRRESYAGWDDSLNRNRLLEAAAALRPRWILSLDADERMTPDDARALRDFLRDGALRGTAYGFRVHRMIENSQSYDDDGLWVFRLFSHREGQRFPRRRLHFVPIPTDIPRGHWIKTTLRIQHFGSLTEERRSERFRKYVEADPDRRYQSDYSHLLDEPGARRVWSTRQAGAAVIQNTGRYKRLRSGAPALRDFDQPLDRDRIRLSVIVISQNDRDRIEEVMDALVAQEVDQPLELIFVNSGQDGTAEFVRGRYPAVRVIHLPRPALPGRARNAGLEVATGDCVTFPGSHIVLPAGSLQARVDAHEIGYAMVCGSVSNGTPTTAGWASYFLDHAVALPGRPSKPMRVAPSRCSYMRDLLLAIGGFPEDRRAGEDTFVNARLYELGYRAYYDAAIRSIHRSPCSTTTRLLRHHFARGLGFGRILSEQEGLSRGSKRHLRRIAWLLIKYPVRRLRFIRNAVSEWGQAERREFYRSLPLIVAGTASAALGAVVFLSRIPPAHEDRDGSGSIGGQRKADK